MIKCERISGNCTVLFWSKTNTPNNKFLEYYVLRNYLKGGNKAFSTTRNILYYNWCDIFNNNNKKPATNLGF